jgi:DNA-binding response OmpR family regulator
VITNQPTLLILDDEEKPRELLQKIYAHCGFQTFGARSTDEAHHLVIAQPGGFDVLILDMNLGEDKTGAAFGIEIREQLQESSPEFLILSKFRTAEYYDLALRLGAAVYLDRNEPHHSAKLIQYTRALAIRHGLRPTRPGLVKELRRISAESRDKSEANTRLCHNLLVPELRKSVGCGFLLLLSDEEGTRAFWNVRDEPDRDELYNVLQNGVFGDLRDRDPKLETESGLPLGLVNARLNYIHTRQREVPFIRLAEVEGLRLSLGLFDETNQSTPVAENSLELAQILGRYMRPAVINHLVEISHAFSDLESQKRGIAEASGTFCFYVGHELLNLVDNAEEVSSSNGGSSNALLPLRALAEELKESGELLNMLTAPTGSEVPADGGDLFDAGGLIQSAWDDLIGRGQIGAAERLEIMGERAAVRWPDFFQAACHRILLWLTRRAIEYPPDTEPSVHVYIDQTPSVGIRFEDGSLRLPKQFRKRLFAPYSAPYLEVVTERKDKGRRFGLFIARALVEAQGGTFEDRSDDLPGEEIGHRLVVSLPQVQ